MNTAMGLRYMFASRLLWLSWESLVGACYDVQIWLMRGTSADSSR
jgi:hypothetical protein